MNNNVISLAERAEDSHYWSPLQAAEYTVKELKKEEASGAKKLITVIINDDGSFRYITSHTTSYDIIAIMELVKSHTIKVMGC